MTGGRKTPSRSPSAAARPPVITIQLYDSRWKALLKPYAKTVRLACAAALPGGDITVVLADDAFVQKLNRDFRGKDEPTNVLSFPESSIPNPQSRYLGDVILARQTVEREAKAQGKTARAHAVHLLVHGTLHLLGHDHKRDREAEKMEALEVKILKKLGISNPYL